MRRVNARHRLDEAGVVVVAAGRQDMILSSRTLVVGEAVKKTADFSGVYNVKAIFWPSPPLLLPSRKVASRSQLL